MNITDNASKFNYLSSLVGINLNPHITFLAPCEANNFEGERCIDAIVGELLHYNPRDEKRNHEEILKRVISDHAFNLRPCFDLFREYSAFRYTLKDYYDLISLRKEYEIKDNFPLMLLDVVLGENQLRLLEKNKKVLLEEGLSQNSYYGEKANLLKQMAPHEHRLASVLKYNIEEEAGLKYDLLRSVFKNDQELILKYSYNLNNTIMGAISSYFIAKSEVKGMISNRDMHIFMNMIRKAKTQEISALEINKIMTYCLDIKRFLNLEHPDALPKMVEIMNILRGYSINKASRINRKS